MGEPVNQQDPEGKYIWPGESHVEEYAWEDLGDITVQQAALGVGALDYASVQALAVANRVFWKPQKRKVALEFRFEMDGSEDDTSVLALYGHSPRIDSSGDVQNDEYVHIIDLTIAQGTQQGNTASTFFANIVTETSASKAWLTATTMVKPSTELDNFMARWLLNKHGYRDFAWIATTRSVTTIHIWGRRL